ncbi:MAG: tetratricopeptide repeat protein [Prevotellaceae bacterium]|jgi:tetratricopeptide (TPR) repeat protein|nr:tetratricopeptide repeat protein [Prevotellaceae bacterium]
MSKQVAKQRQEASVQEALSKSEQFFSTYKNLLLYGALGIIVLFGLGFAWQKLYREPKKEEAMGQMFQAEQAFSNDRFEIALYGDGNILGFTQIADEYGALAGKAIHFYIGVCYLQLGDFQSAIDALTKYSGKDFIIKARAYCCIGDAYVGLNDLKKAEEFYLKAARYHDNPLAAIYLQKAAIINEEVGASDRAISLYQEIKEKYPQTPQAIEADKYIARLKVSE